MSVNPLSLFSLGPRDRPVPTRAAVTSSVHLLGIQRAAPSFRSRAAALRCGNTALKPIVLQLLKALPAASLAVCHSSAEEQRRLVNNSGASAPGAAGRQPCCAARARTRRARLHAWRRSQPSHGHGQRLCSAAHAIPDSSVEDACHNGAHLAHIMRLRVSSFHGLLDQQRGRCMAEHGLAA